MSIERTAARRVETARERTAHDTQPSAEGDQRLRAKVRRFFDESFAAFSEGEARRKVWNAANPYAYGEIHADHPEEIQACLPLMKEGIVTEPNEAQMRGLHPEWIKSVAEELMEWMSPLDTEEAQLEGRIKYLRTWNTLVGFHKAVLASDLPSCLSIFARLNAMPGVASVFEHDFPKLAEVMVKKPEAATNVFHQADKEEGIRMAALLADVDNKIRSEAYAFTDDEQKTSQKKTRKALQKIVDGWVASPDASPLTKYLLAEPSKNGFEERETSYQESDRIWRMIYSPGYAHTTREVKVIARDAFACFDTNDSIVGMAKKSTEIPPVSRTVPSSLYIQHILDCIEMIKTDALGIHDTNDWLEDYEGYIKPYISEAEQKRFEEAWEGTKDGNLEKSIGRILQDWLEGGRYAPVTFNAPDLAMQEMGYRGELSPDTMGLVVSQMHRPHVRERIEKDLGCSLADFSLREQAHLLSLMALKEGDAYQRITTLTRQHGIPAAICLLACENQPALMHTLLSLGETLAASEARIVFESCAQYLVSAQKEATALVEEVFQGQGFGLNQRLVEDTLFARATTTLEQVAENVRRGMSTHEVERSLERATPDMVVLAAVTKAALKGHEADARVSEIKNVSVRSTRVEDMEPHERDERYQAYRQILEENWRKKGEAAAAEALHGLEEGFSRPDTEFFELLIVGKPVAFMRFDRRPDLGENDLYGGSFNVIPELAGSALGSVFLHETLREKGKDHRLHVHVLAADRLGSVYVEEFGFMITGLERDPSSTTSPIAWFKIERAPKGEKPSTATPSLYIGSQNELPAALDWVENVTNNAVITNYSIDKLTGRIQMRAVPDIKKKPATAPQTEHVVKRSNSDHESTKKSSVRYAE